MGDEFPAYPTRRMEDPISTTIGGRTLSKLRDIVVVVVVVVVVVIPPPPLLLVPPPPPPPPLVLEVEREAYRAIRRAVDEGVERDIGVRDGVVVTSWVSPPIVLTFIFAGCQWGTNKPYGVCYMRLVLDVVGRQITLSLGILGWYAYIIHTHMYMS